jgi:hypothetical protein
MQIFKTFSECVHKLQFHYRGHVGQFDVKGQDENLMSVDTSLLS